jgi:hypothetical protein
MDTEEALKVANAAVFAKNKKHLTDIQESILRGSWQGQNYDEIAEVHDYTSQHIKNEGSKLWKLLTQALGEKVGKTNFQSALKQRSPSTEIPQRQEQAQEETPSKNTDFVGREEAIANTTSEEETRGSLRLRLEPLTERVRAWQLEEESPDQQLDALVGITSDDPNFVGRGKALVHLDSLVNEGAKVILIQAEGGVGKTTLARQWFELQGLELLELRVGITSQNIQSVEDWVRHKLRDRFQENPERNFLTMLEQLRTYAKTLDME